MNKQIIAAVIFIVVWIGLLVIWGDSKGIEADKSNPTLEDLVEGGGTGHPLWR